MSAGEDVPRFFGILGALEVRLGGRSVRIAAGKERVVLAALLLHANRPVSSETLIDYIWEEPPKSARTVLHSLVLRLRRAFGDHDVIHTHGPGYLISPAPGELDLDRFHELLAHADEARRVEDAAFERAHLGAALELWRGPALSDIPSDSLQMFEAERLQELRFATLSRRIDLDLQFGDHGELVGELRWLTRAHPFREGLWAQLMIALYRCARRLPGRTPGARDGAGHPTRKRATRASSGDLGRRQGPGTAHYPRRSPFRLSQPGRATGHDPHVERPTADD
jgi:DNA-binding SARP family transcriptional activator